MADEVTNTPYLGVNFNNLRKALYIIFFGIEGSDTFDSENYKYIIPMQASWENPLNRADAKDTYIQFWIERDEELTQDDYVYSDDGSEGYNRQKRVANILLRFIGREAESWSKVFYHVNKRKDLGKVWSGVCNAEQLHYTGACLPTRVEYFGRNTSIVFDVRFKLYYDEVIKINWSALTGVDISVKADISVSGEVTAGK
jgi:hypothetical protein